MNSKPTDRETSLEIAKDMSGPDTDQQSGGNHGDLIVDGLKEVRVVVPLGNPRVLFSDA